MFEEEVLTIQLWSGTTSYSSGWVLTASAPPTILMQRRPCSLQTSRALWLSLSVLESPLGSVIQSKTNSKITPQD